MRDNEIDVMLYKKYHNYNKRCLLISIDPKNWTTS